MVFFYSQNVYERKGRFEIWVLGVCYDRYFKQLILKLSLLFLLLNIIKYEVKVNVR